MQSAPSIDDVRHWIADAEHVAALTGAGISAESGIPTFRDQDNAYWAQFHDSTVKKVSNKVYDGLLKNYGDENGMKSYGMVVDLLTAYYKEPAA